MDYRYLENHRKRKCTIQRVQEEEEQSRKGIKESVFRSSYKRFWSIIEDQIDNLSVSQ